MAEGVAQGWTAVDRPVRVLVTGAGGPSAVGVIRSLAREPRVALHAADIDPNAAGLYLVPVDRRVLLPRGDEPGFADTLLEWCRASGIDVLFPTVDQELLAVARARASFAAAGVAVVLADARALATCLDKWALYQACVGRLPVPRTALLDDGFEARAWDGPVVVKPRRGSGSRGVRVVDDAALLDDLPRDASLLVQELLPGVEHSLDVLASPTGTVGAVVPRLRLKVDSGIAVAARTVHDAALVELGRDVVRTIGLGWVSNVQVRADRKGRPRLLEVNPRFPGSMSLTIEAGIDMPRICLAMALGAPMPATDAFREVAMVRYLEERFVDAAELDANPRAALPPVVAVP
ncbi:MAG: ATP-grasp domain-containing protein [Candidatus Limnocylindrales bacterium]